MIPVLRPSCSDKEIALVTEVLRSGWWGEGSKCKEFEERLAQFYDYDYCVTVNSCTAALHLTLLANDIGPGDEVIVPALTFVSTALAVSYVGAKPVFADVLPDTLCIDWEDVHAKTKPATKAVIAVDFAGYPAGECFRGTKLHYIQDAAHSCGGYGVGDEVCLSFHPVKNLATGDGGAILTKDKAKADRIKALRWCGINRSTWGRNRKGYSWDYDIQEIGYKCHWNDIQAAIGLAQLDRLHEMNQRRWQIAQHYTKELKDIAICPTGHPVHTWHLYIVRVQAERRDQIIVRLAEKGISTSVHYKPLTHYPIYSDQKTPPVTEREWQRMITLPIYADMSDSEQEQVISEVRSAILR